MKLVTIVCVYRSPKSPSSWIYAVRAALSKLFFVYSSMIGDFNIDLLVSTQFSDDIFNFFNFNKHVSAPTCISASSAMLIDHVYTSNINVNSVMVCDISLADHYATVGIIASHGITEKVAHNHRLSNFRSFRKL